MTDDRGRVASVLRVGVLLLLAATCYQLGYNAGFTNSDWTARRQQLWEAASGATDESDEPAAAITPVIDMCDLDGASGVDGIVLCPPAVLKCTSRTSPAQAAPVRPTPRQPLVAAAPVHDPRF